MRSRRTFLQLSLGALVGAVARPAFSASLDLAVIVNPSRQVQKVAAADLDAMFRMLKCHWSDGSVILPFNYAVGDPIRTAFDASVLRMTAEQAAQYWLDQRIRSGLRPPRIIADAKMVRRLVAAMSNAIGYVPDQRSFEEVRVVCRIRGGAVVSA